MLHTNHLDTFNIVSYGSTLCASVRVCMCVSNAAISFDTIYGNDVYNYIYTFIVLLRACTNFCVKIIQIDLISFGVHSNFIVKINKGNVFVLHSVFICHLIA